MEVEICFKLPDSREVSRKVYFFVLAHCTGPITDFSGQVKDSVTGAQLVELIKSETGYPKVMLTCLGLPVPSDKTLRDLDVRSGFVFKVDIDSPEELAKIREKAATLPKTARLSCAYIIEQLCRLAESQIATPFQLAKLLSGDIQKVYVAASRVDKDKILELFRLEESEAPLRLKEDAILHSIPPEVLKNLRTLHDAGYDWNNEQYCRLRAEFVILPALVQARRNANVPMKSSPKRPLKKIRATSMTMMTPRKHDTDPEDKRKDMKMFHEYDLQTEINHPISGIPYVLTGRVDWAAGHSDRGFSDSILVCVEAKKNGTFGCAQKQLTAYLAMCYHERKKANKSVPSVQGFSTDGQLYTFQLLTSDGTLHSSQTFDTIELKNLETVYNFIVQQVETAIHLSPTSTPVKGFWQEKQEAAQTYARDSAWGIFDPVPYCSDGEEGLIEPKVDIEIFALRERGFLT